MEKETAHNILIDMILSPRYKVLRHGLVWTMVLSFSLSNVLTISEYLPGKFNFPIAVIIYYVLILAAVYTNINIGVKKILMRSNFFSYFCFLLVLVIFCLGGILLLQIAFMDVNGVEKEINPLNFAINLLSSLLLLGLIVAGTTTLVLFKSRLISEYQINDLKSSSLKSELQYLKNQINPHFLFNMLNSVNVLLKEKAGGAAQLMSNLQDLLQYQINGSAKDWIYLKSDVAFLQDFLNLEKLRRDKFDYLLTTTGNIDHIKLPPLLFIPFIENAVKYSQDGENPSYVNIWLSVADNKLTFRCENSIPPYVTNPNHGGGLGLKNIRRRLELLFPEKHLLQMDGTNSEFIVNMQIDITV